MFNTQHILYMIISACVTAALLVLCALFVKTQAKKELILKASAVITVIIHYSNLLVNFFANNGQVYIENNHILPVYPCNVVMWMLLIASMIKNKNGIPFRLLADFCFFVGLVCSVVGIAFNINFANNPTLADYDILKGMLSHSTMLFGCLYLFVGGFIKIEVFNALSITAGLGVFVICGLLVNGLYLAFGMTPPDGMFLLSNPYIPVSPIFLGILVVLIMFGILCLYEQRLPKEERWYSRLRTFVNKFKNKKEN